MNSTISNILNLKQGDNIKSIIKCYEENEIIHFEEDENINENIQSGTQTLIQQNPRKRQKSMKAMDNEIQYHSYTENLEDRYDTNLTLEPEIIVNSESARKLSKNENDIPDTIETQDEDNILTVDIIPMSVDPKSRAFKEGRLGKVEILEQ